MMLRPLNAAPPAESPESTRADIQRLVRNLWLLAALALLVAGIALQRVAPAAVGALVLLTGIVAMLWSRLSMERVSYERRWSAVRAFVGEELEATFTLRNRKTLPLPWFEVREVVPDQLPPAGARRPHPAWAGALYFTHTTSLAWYERVSWRQRFACTTRGFFEFGPTRLRSGDIFGFFPREQRRRETDRITVLPRLIELGDVALPVHRPFGDARGGNRIFEDQSRISGLRDYRPGDPLKRIDWKATARRGALQSRLYEPSATVSLIVALSVDTFAHPWEGHDPLLLERAVSVAASIASLAESSRYAVGMLANCSYPGAERPLFVPPNRDPGQLVRVFEALAMVAPFTIMTPQDLLERERRRFPLGVGLAVVAGFLSDGLAAYLDRMRLEGVSLALYWVGDRPPTNAPRDLPLYDLSAVLRQFERVDPMAYGGETRAGGPGPRML